MPLNPHTIPNRWYAVLEQRRLKSKPVAVDRLGAKLVLWRDGSGRAAAMIDRCVHKGAALSLGRVRDGCLECPYHGLLYDPDGEVKLVPYMGRDYRIPKTWRVDAFSVREEHGLVWVWYGDGPPSERVPWFDHVRSDLSRSWQASGIWPFDYTRIMDSNLDVYHFPFVHRSLNPNLGPVVSDYQADIDGDLIRTRTTLSHYRDSARPGPDKVFPIDVLMPCLMYIEFSRKLSLVVFVTPVDDQRSWLVARYYADYPMGSLIAWMVGRFEWKIVQDQDKRILATLREGPVGEREYVFGKPDRGSILWAKRRRQLLAEAADASGDIERE